MAATGGRMPFDASGALAGPARVLYAETATAIPDDLWDVVPPVADADGEYPAVTGWKDFGLAADAPTYSHDKAVEGLQYQQSRGALFEQITEINRSFVAQVGQIDPENMLIVENADAIETVVAAAGKSGMKLVRFGVYDAFKSYRIALVSYRPSGSGDVTEPSPSGAVRPAAVALILPKCVLSADASEFSFEAGTPTNASVSFTILPETTLGPNEQHGFWAFEDVGVIA
jgi:hypothetical protein